MSLVLQSVLPDPDSCQGPSPHQQGWDTKMADLFHGGIDVASDRLDVMLLPHGQCFWVGNNAVGWAELVERLRGLCIAAIGIEASGGYERGVLRALLAAGISVRQINPFKLRQFVARMIALQDELSPPHEHLPRKRTLLSITVKHGSTRAATSADTGVDGVRIVGEGQEPGLMRGATRSPRRPFAFSVSEAKSAFEA